MSQTKNMICATILAASTSPALAQQEQTGDEQSRSSTDDFHDDDEIVVTAGFVEKLDILAGTSVLSGDQLTEDLRGQIGDSLTSLPGVSSTSFAPGSSRPILRGFQGPRVRVLTDGIGSLDVSNTSVDHAVTIDPLTAVRVEVLRGPAVLLFGGDAIGGAVNVIDKRIPRDVPDESFHIDAITGYGSAADDFSAAGSLDVPLTPSFVFHIDGSFRDTRDADIPGFVIAPELRANILAAVAEETAEGNLEEAAELAGTADLRGRIPNTATRTQTAGAGLAYIGDGGQIGFSVSYYDSGYGVPERPGASHADDADGEEEEGPVTIAIEQIRADLRSSVNLGGFFETLNLRAGFSDYDQIEFEGDEIGTIFQVEGIEARAELVQSDKDGWRGVIGTQFLARDFNAIGVEAFVPKNTVESWAVFTVQELDLGDYELEAAVRYDGSKISSDIVNFNRSFNAISAALGLAYAPDEGDIKIGANLSRSTRAPSAEELLSNGPHIATQSFEIGNPGFATEKSWGGEIYARFDSDAVKLTATLFANIFDDYIFDTDTGAVRDGLPVFQFFQRDATYYGLEASAFVQLAQIGTFNLIADGVADFVRARINDGGGPVPRIPPLRLLGGIEAESDNLKLRAEVEWADSQNRIATFETATEGFTMVNASAAWHPRGKSGNITLLASANNVFDVNARRHASFTKDFVPLTGRDIRVSMKLSF